MLRFLSSLIIILALIAAGLYLASGIVLKPLIQKALLTAADQSSSGYGVTLQSPDIASAKWKLPATIHIENFSAKLHFIEPQEDIPESLDVSSKRILLSVINFDDRLIGVRIEGLAVDFPQAEASSGKHKKIEAIAHFKTRLDFTEPQKAARQIETLVKDLLRFIRTGKSKTPIEFQGTAAFELNGQTAQGRLRTDRVLEESTLVMDREDLKNFVSKHLTEPLTDAEIELIAEYPLRAPNLLKIRDNSQADARAAKEKSPGVPEDAYRHVLWSYRLTKAYGEVFSKQATDAHEQKSPGENFDAENKKDLQNNALGRRYAMVGFEESSLLAMIIDNAAPAAPPPAFTEETNLEEEEVLEEEEEDRRPVNVLGEIG